MAFFACLSKGLAKGGSMWRWFFPHACSEEFRSNFFCVCYLAELTRSIEQFVQGISRWYRSGCILLSISKWRRQGKGFKSLIMAWTINTCFSATSPLAAATKNHSFYRTAMALLENETSSNESAIECVSKREKPAFKAKKTFGMVPVLGELCVLSFSRGGWTKKTRR